RRIECINVETQITGRVAEHRSYPLRHSLGAIFMHFLRGDDGNALLDGPVEHLVLDRRSDADLDNAAGVDETLLDRVIDHGSVRVGLAEAVGPSIDVRIEMHERKRA